MEEKWRKCIKDSFPADVSKQLLDISLHHVNSVLTWLHHADNSQYRGIANKMSLSDILNTKVSFKAVLLDNLADVADESEDGERALEMLGDRIAAANNETQKVDAGDLFGTGNRIGEIRNSSDSLPRDIKIEYRRFEEDRAAKSNQRVIHVLDLLRAILPTTFIVDPKPVKPKPGEDLALFVAGYANMREPIYNWFTRIIKSHKSKKHPDVERAIVILRNLMPDMAIMMGKAEKVVIEQRKALSFDRVSEWTLLSATSLQIFEDDGKTILKKNADSEIRRFLSFSLAIFSPCLFSQHGQQSL